MQDAGDCCAARQPKIRRMSGGRTATLFSFLEIGSGVVGINRITDEDVRQLGAEVVRLQANRCYRVCVRMFVTGTGVTEALAHCDLVFILAHGKKTGRPITLGGDPGNDVKPPRVIAASSVWIGACYAEATVVALNGPTGTVQRYRTLPHDSFDADGTIGLHTMIQGLIGELRKLTTTRCDAPLRVCILSGVRVVDVR